MRTILLATAATCLLGMTSAFAQTAPTAPTAPAAAAPAPEAPLAPRIKGSSNGGPMDKLVYSVACKKVDLTQYERAADELFTSEGAAAIAKAETVFNSGQDNFGAYVDCVQSNYNDDRDELIKVLSDKLGSTIKDELARIDTEMAAITTALQARASKGFKAAPKPRAPKKGEPAPAAEVAPVLPTPEETKARFTGRHIGSITAGELASAQYTSACPRVAIPVTLEEIPLLATPVAFNALTDRLKTLNDQFVGFQDCLNTNANDDLKTADDAMLAGINVNVRADQQTLNKALGDLQRVITTKKEDLAAATARRAPAKPAAKPAPRRR